MVTLLPGQTDAVVTEANAVTPAPTPANLVAVLIHPAVLVPVTVYVVLADGLADTDAPVAAERPVDGDHEYVAAPVAVIVTADPPQTATVDGLTDSVGLAFTVRARVT